MGLSDARLVETPGAPAVLGSFGVRPDRPTVLLYGHYDVQPAGALSAWSSSPFTPEVRDGVLYGRGVSDDKGQLWAHLSGVAAWLRVTGDLPVNLRLLVDGEEEVGSPHLPRLLSGCRRELACDVAVISDTRGAADGRPALTVSQRGLLSASVVMSRPGGDVHAGRFGGGVPDPALALAQGLAGLARDRRWLGPAGGTRRQRMTVRPAWTVTRLEAGLGAGSVVTSSARASLDVRLAAGQSPDAVFDALTRRLSANLPAGLTVRVHRRAAVPAIAADLGHPAVAAAVAAYTCGFGIAPVGVRSGATIPVVHELRRLLGVETLLLGFGAPDDHAHGPDERLPLCTYDKAVATVVALLPLLAAAMGSTGR
jgi:acetylornithine deacetylase/succinyl-diaminopimelate desuccinylase-like protein